MDIYKKNIVDIDNNIVLPITRSDAVTITGKNISLDEELLNIRGNISDLSDAMLENVDNLNNELLQSSVNLSSRITNVENNIGNINELANGESTIVSSINQLFQSVSNGKEYIASAITDRGIETIATETFLSMAQKIRMLSIGGINSGSISYGFFNDNVGSAHGSISITSSINGNYELFWGDIEGNKITDYQEPFGSLLITPDKGFGTYNVMKHMFIPYQARTMIAYSNGSKVGVLALPNSKILNISSKKYSFGLLSDVHMRVDASRKYDSPAKLTKALNYFKNQHNLDLTIISGDAVTLGSIGELEKFKEIKDAFQNDMTIYCTRGNHDTYVKSTVSRYTQYIEPNGLYFKKIIGGDVYLFVGQSLEDQANPYMDYTLDWLESELIAHKNERVFVVGHVFVEPTGNTADLYPFSPGMLNTNGTTGGRFRKLMKKFRNAILFTGHSHLEFSIQRFSDVANVSERTEDLCHRVHTPSCAYTRICPYDKPTGVTHNYEGSQGYIVDVYDDYIVLRGIDFQFDKYVTEACYILDTRPIEIEHLEYQLRKIGGYTTFESGSLSSSGLPTASTSSMRSGMIMVNENTEKKIVINKGGRITYLRVAYYDENQNFIRVAVNDIYNDGRRISSGTEIADFPDNAKYFRFKCQGELIDIEEILTNAVGERFITPVAPEYPKYPDNIFFEEEEPSEKPVGKYDLAKWNALEFIKRQLNVSNYKIPIYFNEEILTIERVIDPFSPDPPEDNIEIIELKLAKGRILGLSNANILRNKFFSVDSNYDEEYMGIVRGTWYDSLNNPEDYVVDVYVITDQKYFVERCSLQADYSWSTSKVTNKGMKHYELVSKRDGNILEYAYPVVDNYSVKIFKHLDVEYELESCPIFLIGEEYIFYSNSDLALDASNKDENYLAKVLDINGNVVGVGGIYKNFEAGRLPASYLIPEDDPNYNKDGGTALGKYGYMMNSRSYTYDIGLALAVFSESGNLNIAKEIMDRMRIEQNSDGSYNFSYDIYIGSLFEPYIRTGSIGWLVWGMCNYIEKSGDTSYNDVLNKVGDWILLMLVTNQSDPRYGLLRGGYGGYDSEYNYVDTNINWCSTEHNSSTLPAIAGLYRITGLQKYLDAYNLIIDSMMNKLYDNANGRFYQGLDAFSKDEAWALDCLSWAGTVAHLSGNTDKSSSCISNIFSNFLVQNESIEISQNPENYNTRYSFPEGVTINGFKPYHLGYNNPPSLVWSEGTLGVILLLMYSGDNRYVQYLDHMIELQNCNGSSGGVLYTTKTVASLPWEFHSWESVVSSAWIYLLLKNKDVLFNISLSN